MKEKSFKCYTCNEIFSQEESKEKVVFKVNYDNPTIDKDLGVKVADEGRHEGCPGVVKEINN